METREEEQCERVYLDEFISTCYFYYLIALCVKCSFYTTANIWMRQAPWACRAVFREPASHQVEAAGIVSVFSTWHVQVKEETV